MPEDVGAKSWREIVVIGDARVNSLHMSTPFPGGGTERKFLLLNLVLD